MHSNQPNIRLNDTTFSNVEKELSPNDLFALAHWLDDSHQTEQAMAIYKKAIAADPNFAEAYFNLGLLFSQMKDQAEAIKCYEKAMALKPDMAACHTVLGMYAYGQNRLDDALELLEKAVAIDPHSAEAQFNLGIVLKQIGEYGPSVACFQKALVCDPSLAAARWLHLLSLPMVYDTVEQIQQTRQKFNRNLDDLICTTQLNTSPQRLNALQGISTATNFYLQYQGRNDLDMQKKYGRLVHDVMAANYPRWHQQAYTPLPQKDEKIRVGYLSSYMCRHTVGSFLSGWIENHNTERFEIYGYHIGQKNDALTSHLKAHCHQFHHLPANIETVSSQIVSDRLHVLVYFEIGMHVETLQLAALRLAPIQCASWGHPVTTGLPTIDYFLSSEQMEPKGASAHYSEMLVRFPNLSLCYHPPELPCLPKSKKALGIPSNRFIFLSSQSIYKYLPQYDDIYPLIAKKVPNACFVFISHQSRQATQKFRNRLRSAFKHHHLDADTYCYFSQRLDSVGFLSLNIAADVFLDTFEWSGGKTTLEAISCGLPVVTCPGRFMRGRHAYAMLSMMGMDNAIAKDKTDYCRIAARLATDPTHYADVKKQFLNNRRKLYNDKVFIKALEDFYSSQVKALGNTPPGDGHPNHCQIENITHSAEAYHQEGIAYLSSGAPRKALNAFEQAYGLESHNPQHPFRMAQAHLLLDNTEAAVAAYHTTLRLRPDWDAAHYNMAVALRSAERIDEAIHHAQEAIRYNPGYFNAYPLLFRLAQHACDWPLIETVSKDLDEITRKELHHGLKTTEPPLTNIRRLSNVEQNIKVAQSWSNAIVNSTQHHSPAQAIKQASDGSYRIRVGYLSSDYKDHAVAYQILGMLQNHHRKQFEIYGYACNSDDGSPYRKKLADACDHFKDLHASSNQDIAQQIRRDGIHILMDMSGHSRANRLGIAALRPAPVQVSYLGFLSSTGAPFIDYVIADPIVIPKKDEKFYSEKVAYLPHCYQANDDRMPIARQEHGKSDWGLPDQSFVFCSFNQPYKIDAHLFRTWMEILKGVEKSVLWLVKRSSLARKNLCDAACRYGVDPQRLIFTGFVPLEQNLARLQFADLVLDTLIYNGGATTANALWAGVPTLSIPGNHWVSRMSASALHAIGLPDLIAEDLEDYRNKAMELALNPAKYAALRKKLWRKRLTSPLFNTALFTRHIEAALKHMWHRHLDGLKPASFKIEP